MEKVNFPEQRQEIQDLLKRSHLSIEDLHERVGLKVETLKSYAEGWGKCGQGFMVAIRQVAEREIDRLDRAAGKSMPADEMHEDVVKYAAELLALPQAKRDLAKGLIDALRDKGDCRPKREVSSPADPAALARIKAFGHAHGAPTGKPR